MTARCGPRYKLLCLGKITAKPPVGLPRKALQVDIHGIRIWKHLLKDCGRNAPVGHNDRLQPIFAGKPCRISYIFITYQRLVIGKGDPDITLPRGGKRNFNKLVRHHPLRSFNDLLTALGYLMILAEGALQITAEASCREDPAPGTKPLQRLFLDGIQGKPGDDTVINRLDLPSRILSYSAEALPSLRNTAMPEADLADRDTAPSVLL